MTKTNGEEQPWYAVRCLLKDESNTIYEERTILVRAASDHEAIEKAEKDALKHAKILNMEYQFYADSYHLSDENIGEYTEVFSLMRESDIDRDAYVNRYLDSGNELRKK